MTEKPPWLGPNAKVNGRLGTTQTTAQVIPDLFTKGMLTASKATLVEGAVNGFIIENNQLTNVLVNGSPLKTDSTLIALGPWSVLACRWLPLPGVFGLKGHSLIFRFNPDDPKALFVKLEYKTGNISTPEVMPRMDGSTYVCGLSGDAPLPIDPTNVGVEEGGPEKLLEMIKLFSPDLGKAEIISAQACYRPVTQDGLPLIGAIPNVRGAYISTGHGVWGMLNGPGSGEAIAELILDGYTHTIDISPFNPNRLPSLDASSVMEQYSR